MRLSAAGRGGRGREILRAATGEISTWWCWFCVLLAGNVAFHLEAHFHGLAETGIRIGIAVVVLLISLIGGRIIPSFTRNWLVRENPGRLPVPFGRFDMVVVAVTALTLVGWVVSSGSRLTGAALAFAGLLQLVRLARWAGDRTVARAAVADPACRLRLRAARIPAQCRRPRSAWCRRRRHSCLDGGAAGIMTLAVMSRATLGHTGQPLTASAPRSDLSGHHRRGAGAGLRGDRAGLRRAPAASRCIWLGRRLLRLRDILRTAAGRRRSPAEGGRLNA